MHTWSHCKHCRCYHLKPGQPGLRADLIRCLTPKQAAEAVSFDWYIAPTSLSFIETYFVQPDAMPVFLEWLKSERGGDPFVEPARSRAHG